MNSATTVTHASRETAHGLAGFGDLRGPRARTIKREEEVAVLADRLRAPPAALVELAAIEACHQVLEHREGVEVERRGPEPTESPNPSLQRRLGVRQLPGHELRPCDRQVALTAEIRADMSCALEHL